MINETGGEDESCEFRQNYIQVVNWFKINFLSIVLAFSFNSLPNDSLSSFSYSLVFFFSSKFVPAQLISWYNSNQKAPKSLTSVGNFRK